MDAPRAARKAKTAPKRKHIFTYLPYYHKTPRNSIFRKEIINKCKERGRIFARRQHLRGEYGFRHSLRLAAARQAVVALRRVIEPLRLTARCSLCPPNANGHPWGWPFAFGGPEGNRSRRGARKGEWISPFLRGSVSRGSDSPPDCHSPPLPFDSPSVPRQ